jgi:hypothetical protein
LRVLQLKQPHFSASLNAHAPQGTSAYEAVIRVLGQLQNDLELPGPADRWIGSRPTGRASYAPIPSEGLLVCYALRGQLIYALAVKRIG